MSCELVARVGFVVFEGGCPPCTRCGASLPAGSLGAVVLHVECEHMSGFCERCALFNCVVSDAEDGEHMADDFLAWCVARRAEMN